MERMLQRTQHRKASSEVADWSRKFADPIPLPNSRRLVTLRDAGEYISALPEAEQNAEGWRTATELLMLVAERGRDPMFARCLSPIAGRP
jgi:hypothetical protein